MKVSHDQCIQFLEKIENSREFRASSASRRLLNYLVKESLAGREPKEYDIALDVYRKQKDFNPSQDSTVRVSVSNLRKKLNAYYHIEGAKDTLKILLPLGNYSVQFIEAGEETETSRKPFRFQPIAYIGLMAVLVLLTILFILPFEKKNRIAVPSEQPLWEGIAYGSSRPLNLSLGNDLFFLLDLKTKPDSIGHIYEEEMIVRKHYINTLEAFENFQNSYSDDRYQLKTITPYSFMPMISILGLPKLLNFLHPVTPSRLSSSIEIGAGDILESDILFLGSFRNLYGLSQVLQPGAVRYFQKYEGSGFTLQSGDSTLSFFVEGLPQAKYVDYCLLRKVTGPEGNTILLFIAVFEAAMKLAIEQMTEPENLQEISELFIQRYGVVPKNYDIVFSATGFERTPFHGEIVYFSEIADTALGIW